MLADSMRLLTGAPSSLPHTGCLPAAPACRMLLSSSPHLLCTNAIAAVRQAQPLQQQVAARLRWKGSQGEGCFTRQHGWGGTDNAPALGCNSSFANGYSGSESSSS